MGWPHSLKAPRTGQRFKDHLSLCPLVCSKFVVSHGDFLTLKVGYHPG